MNRPPVLSSLTLLVGDTKPAEGETKRPDAIPELVVELCPSFNKAKPEMGWREQAKRGKPAMFYSIQGSVGIGSELVRVTINVDAVKEGVVKDLGIEPTGTYVDKVTGVEKVLAKRGVSQFQSTDCAKFHVADGVVIWDEPEIITDAGEVFPLIFGVKYLVYKAQRRTVKLNNVRLTYKEVDVPVSVDTGESVTAEYALANPSKVTKVTRVYASAHADGIEIVDVPRAVALGNAISAADFAAAAAPKTVVTTDQARAARATRAAPAANVPVEALVAPPQDIPLPE
jgi:hypothetical protein